MKSRNKLYKIIILTVMVTMLFSQSIFAQEIGGNPTAPNMKFDDVPATHWGLKHVTKLALLGIIQGKGEGRFDPDAPVSQQEVLIMAIRMMGLQDQVNQKNASYLFPFDMDDWAKPYVDEALNQRLITIQEEAAASTSSQAWGSREATREWVAKIVIRALGMQDEAAKLGSTATVFGDNKDITPSYLGFINAAVNLKIVGGFADGTFKPLDKVTRAQMATFLSRADQYLEQRPKNVSVGYVAQFTNSKLAIVDHQGKLQDFALGEGIVFYSNKDETARIPSSSIKQDTLVYVIHDQGRAYYVEDLHEVRTTSEAINGILQEISLNNMTLSLMTDKGLENFKITGTTAVVGEDGKGSSFSALVAGSQLEVKKWGDTVEHITIRSVPINKSGEATIERVNMEAAHITWIDEESGETERFVYSGQLSITYNGTPLQLDQVHPGDVVKYKVENDILTSLEVVTPVVEPFTSENRGKLVSYDRNANIIVISTSDGEYATYQVPANVQVIIEGMSSANLDDLVVQDELKIELKERDIRTITVLNRQVKAKLLSTIRSYDKDLQMLTVLDTEGKPHLYFLTTSTAISYEGMSVTLNNFDNYFLKGKKVDITASSDKIISIRMATSYEGTFQQIHPTNNTLTMMLVDGNQATFKLATYPSIDVAGSMTTSTSVLKPGDEIRVTLNPTQDQIMGITVHRTIMFKLESKDILNRKVVLREPLKEAVTYTLDANTPIVNAAGTSMSLAEIPVNAAVSVSFFGTKIEKIAVQNTIRGKITEMDTAAGKVTVEDYHQSKQVIVIGASPVIIQNGVVLNGLSMLKVGDRVEIVNDMNSKTYIQVATSMKRVVSSYDAFSKQLSLKRTTPTDQAQYSFHDYAYIHDGKDTMNPNFLYDPNEIMIYLLDGKIMELELLP